MFRPARVRMSRGKRARECQEWPHDESGDRTRDESMHSALLVARSAHVKSARLAVPFIRPEYSPVYRIARSRVSGEYRLGRAIEPILSRNRPSDKPGTIQFPLEQRHGRPPVRTANSAARDSRATI